MYLINFFLNNNLIFKYYFILLLLFNIFIFCNLVFRVSNFNNNINIDVKYNLIFKKLIKISKNPIIFDYQLKQMDKIDYKSNKYIQCKKYINNINNKKISIYENYKKIIKILAKKKLSNINDILIKLLYINFM